MKLRDFLGKHVAALLSTEPFDQWPVNRNTEDDLEEPIVNYEFGEHAMDLLCDRDDKISTISLHADRNDPQDGFLLEIPLAGPAIRC